METNLLTRPGFHGAFVHEGFDARPNTVNANDELKNLRLAVKDVFDVAGQRTGAGNPDWFAQQATARSTALAVDLLLGAGSQWVGRTVTDELAFSLAGINAHYGTPLNPGSVDRIPGGSSSGSAVAVAAGLADIGLGTDCGGSCRLPASFCGVWGIRPTQGRISTKGCFSLAHSFDTVGWFTPDGSILGRVYSVLANEALPAEQDVVFTVIDDALTLCGQPVRDKFKHLQRQLSARFKLNHLPQGSLPLADWAQAHRILQGAEIWQQHGAWVSQYGAGMAADVQQRFATASRVNRDAISAQQRVRINASTHLAALLQGESTVFLMPTVPSIAPRLNAGSLELEKHRAAAQQLLSIAGLAGLPQVSLPWITLDGASLGLSVIGARGADGLVIRAAQLIDELLMASP